MLSINKIRTVGYAVCMRLKGYQLLQNPKGASPYEVNMIKKEHYVNAMDYSDNCKYTRVRRDFSSNAGKDYTKELDTRHFIDPDTKQKNGKKIISLVRDGHIDVKSSISQDEFDQSRPVYWGSVINALAYTKEREKAERITYSQNLGFWAILRKNLNNQ